VGRHAQQAGQVRSRSPQVDELAGGGTAVLTDSRDLSGVDSRVGGPGLSSAFEVSAVRRGSYDLPSIGTPEHTALLSGGLDLAGMMAAQEQGPLVGFLPIVLDPAGPTAADLADVERQVDRPGGGGRSGGQPAGRSARSGAAAGSRPGATRSAERAPRSAARQAPAARTGPPGQRPSGGGPARGRVRPAPPVVAGPPTAALCIDEMLASLAGFPALVPDPTPTGELARPFVDEACLAEGPTEIDEVPPPISVDVFQKAVRAGVAPEDAAAALAAAPGADLDEVVARVAAARAGVQPGASPRRRTRREQRARERALTSVRGITARRLAKGGVLAITALGVVSSATPQTLGALGLDRDDFTATQGALDFAGALAPKVNVPQLSPEGKARREQLRREKSLRQELADADADAAANAGVSVGGALLAQAFQQDQELEARHRAELARAAREANRNPRRFARALAAEHGWTGTQFQCLDRLWTRESGWNYRAVNRSSGAYGIAQSLPGSKMAAVGADWRTNAITQIKWGLNYIDDRYGTPCGAWAHSQSTGWY
jgi:hypothetical protein